MGQPTGRTTKAAVVFELRHKVYLEKMFATSQKSIALCGLLMVYSFASLQGQAIYSGGNNDGFAKGIYSEPDPSRDIYFGGVNDGFALSAYSEADPTHDIYQGGVNDGFAKFPYSEPDPANDIFAGGSNDGFALDFFAESDPSSDIYRGGYNDGFAKLFFSEELALPVEWRYFTVAKRNGKPILRWGADKEDKCLLYEVLRSDDGKNFESISEIKCEGKAVDNEYEFEDHSPLWHRILYYKIAQHDIDGRSTHSEVKTFVATSPAEPEVFYNNGQLIVRVEREAELHSIAVYDYTGRTLCRQSTHGAESFYTIDCELTQDQLVIVHMVFNTFAATTHLRIGK